LHTTTHGSEHVKISSGLKKLRKKLVQCYIWRTSLYGANTWTLPKADQKYLENFEMCCWRRMEKISFTNGVKIGTVFTMIQRGQEYPRYNKKTEG
jgi:hypothetical protein